MIYDGTHLLNSQKGMQGNNFANKLNRFLLMMTIFKEMDKESSRNEYHLIASWYSDTKFCDTDRCYRCIKEFKEVEKQVRNKT